VNSLWISFIHKNKSFFIICLLLFSLMTVYMPHSLVENSEDQSSFSVIINNYYKLVEYLRKLPKKFRPFVNKLFRMPQKLLNKVVLATILLVLFNMRLRRFSKVSIVHIFFFLYFYFCGSKYKHNMNHSDLLPLMGV